MYKGSKQVLYVEFKNAVGVYAVQPGLEKYVLCIWCCPETSLVHSAPHADGPVHNHLDT